MTTLTWDDVGEKLYETGTDRGVLYLPTGGDYSEGYAWNGLTGVTESPSGAEATALWANNGKYLNLISVEEFGGTLEAYTYPDEFGQCDGTAEPETGLLIAQQDRATFGFSFRTILGNDEDGNANGYKLHLVYGALAAPSEKAYATVNDSPEAITFSWTFTTTPVPVTGYKATSLVVIDSTKVSSVDLAAIEDALYGTVGTDPRLPLPDELIGIVAGAQTVVIPTEPGFVAGTGVITIPTVTGVVYRRADTGAVVPAGAMAALVGSGTTLGIYAVPASGAYVLDPTKDDDWTFTRS